VCDITPNIPLIASDLVPTQQGTELCLKSLFFMVRLLVFNVSA